MNATTVAVDLAKSVFQLAVADASWKVVESHRLTRSSSSAGSTTATSRSSSWSPAAPPITGRVIFPVWASM